MGPEKKSDTSRSSGATREPVAKSPLACESAGISQESAPRDGEREFQDMMSIVTDLQRQLEHHLELNGTLEKEMGAIRTSKQEAETLVTARTQEIERIREEASSLHAENERLMVELTSSEEERSEAAKVISRQKDDLQGRKQEIQSLRERLSSLEKTLEVTQREAESREQDSQEKIRQLKLDTEGLEKRLKRRTQELSRANALIDDLNREKERLEGEVAHLDRTRTNLSKIHETLKGVQDQMLNREAPRCTP